VEGDQDSFDPDGMIDGEFILSVCKGLVQVDIASTCLTYLSFDTSKTGKSLIRGYPFYPYAAMFWVDHASGEPEGFQQDKIYRLVRNSTAWSRFIERMVQIEKLWHLKTGKLQVLPVFARLGLEFTNQNSPNGIFDRDFADAVTFSKALNVATINGHSGVVNILLERANTSSLHQDVFGTALLRASFYGDLEVVRMLMDARAIVNGVDLPGSKLTAFNPYVRPAKQDMKMSLTSCSRTVPTLTLIAAKATH
jgi:hypothetical protein